MVIGALAAPRPLLMMSASGDWTANTPREEYPAIQSIYKLLSAEQNVETKQIDQVHNYNKDTRESVYAFLGAKLLGTKGPVPEARFKTEQLQDLLALFGREKPAGAVPSLDAFVAERVAEARRDTESLHPHDRAMLDKAQAALGERLTFSLLASRPAPAEVVAEKKETMPRGETLLIGRAGKGDRIPAVWLTPAQSNPAVPPTLIIHPDGAAWVRASSQNANGLAKGILDRGGVVIGIDAFQTGSAKAPREDSDKRGFTWFNQTDDANRVQDILTALSYVQSRSGSSTVNLVGLEMGGVWSYFARAVAGPGVNLASDLAHFRSDTDQEYIDRFYIPGLRKAGDFRAAGVANAQGKLLLHDAGPEFPADWVRDSAAAAGTVADVRPAKATEADLLAWVAPEPLPPLTGKDKKKKREKR
jgi:hypothetical protein